MAGNITPSKELRNLPVSLPSDPSSPAQNKPVQLTKAVRPSVGTELEIMEGGTLALVISSQFTVIPANALRVTLIIENRSSVASVYIGGNSNNRPIPNKYLGIELRPLEKQYLDLTGEVSLKVLSTSCYVFWAEITSGERQ